MNKFRQEFENVIVENSLGSDFGAAIKEWVCVSRYTESTRCVCGKEIKYCFAIENVLNGKTLDPVGSVCIQRLDKELEDFKSTELYKTYNELNKVYCKECGKTMSPQSYEKHLTTKTHLDNIGSRKCLDCDNRIKANEPSYKIRCLQCYIKSKREDSRLYPSYYLRKQMEKKQKEVQKELNEALDQYF